MANEFNAAFLSRRQMLGLTVGAAGLALLPRRAHAGQTNPKLATPKEALPRTVALLEKL